MWIITEKRLADFARKHPKARKPLAVWARIVKAAHWRTPHDVTKTFTDADVLRGGLVVFDLASYRLAVTIKYVNERSRVGRIYVREVLTHDEYLRRSREGRL